MDSDFRSCRFGLFPVRIPECIERPLRLCSNINANPFDQDTSVYKNPYTETCYAHRHEQIRFLESVFASSKADWKFLQLHHPYYSASQNETDLQPLIEIVAKHKGTVLNGHDHCMGHFVGNDTNFVLSGGAGYPQAGDCNNGTALGPYAKFLGANSLSGQYSSITSLGQFLTSSVSWKRFRNYGH